MFQLITSSEVHGVEVGLSGGSQEIRSMGEAEKWSGMWINLLNAAAYLMLVGIQEPHPITLT